MSAGLISYKLCERGFDCENCPLDAALRGEHVESPRISPGLNRRADSRLFPADRLYGPGHLWVQSTAQSDPHLWRIGLDSFAAALIGCLGSVRVTPPGSAVNRGDPVAEIDVGIGKLTLGAPFSGRVTRSNESLRDRPQQGITDPYGQGWLLEVREQDPAGILALRSSVQARAASDAELHRFRRTLALRLLTESRTLDTLTDRDPDSLADLRHVLGGPRYLELLTQFIR
jgi:glycine cleavage system H protein